MANRRKERHRVKKRGAIVSAIVIVAVVAGVAIWFYPTYEEWQLSLRQEEEDLQLLGYEAFYKGIQIDSVSVGGHSFDEVAAALEERDQKEKDSVNIKLTYNGINYSLTGENAGMYFDSRAVAEEAYALGRRGTDDERLSEIKRVELEGAAFETSSYYDKASVLSFVTDVSEYILADVDVDTLCGQVYAALDDLRYDQIIPIEVTMRAFPETENIDVVSNEANNAQSSDIIESGAVSDESGSDPVPDTTDSNTAAASIVPEQTPTPAAPKTVKLHKSDWVNVRDIIPSINYNMVRATENNAFNTVFYSIDACILRAGTAAKLKEAQKLVQKDGYTIRIYDAYRPLSAQKKMYEILPDTRYVANPANGSRHNRGAAVDVTLMKDGVEVDMPSAYESFSNAAHRASNTMTDQQRANMDYLTKIMEQCGFSTISTEWWHFDDTDYNNYPISDADFEELLEQMDYSR